MKILIEIPEVRYNQILDENHTIEHYLEDAVRHGTPIENEYRIGYDEGYQDGRDGCGYTPRF